MGEDLLIWIVVVAAAALSALALVRSLWRKDAQRQHEVSDLDLYKAQLSDIERDLERGTVTPDEAARLRVEIGRRILAADRAEAAAALPARVGPKSVIGAIALGLFAAPALYAWLGAPGYGDLPHDARIARAEAQKADRMSQAAAVAEAGTAPLNAPTDPQMADLMAKLRTAVAQRPDDLQGQELLARNEAALGNAAAAAAAQERVVAIKGDKATAGDLAQLADSMILAADGYVSPEAEEAVLAALDRDPGNGTARFYLGLLEAQTGRPDRAFALWRDLLETSPPEAPWVPVIRDQIGFLARAAGVEYQPPIAAPGPTEADMNAAQNMTAEDRNAMIRGMVEQLETRIANEGGTAEEWARLIASLGVLRETDRARSAWTKAQDVFAADPAGMATVADAADQAGVAE